MRRLLDCAEKLKRFRAKHALGLDPWVDTGSRADESSGTIKKRFDAIKVEFTEDTRRDYREMLFRSKEAMSKYISGEILYDETIWQKAKDGTPLVKLIGQAGAIKAENVRPDSRPSTTAR